MSALVRAVNQPANPPDNWIATQTPDVYLCDTIPSPLPAGAVVIGEWLADGTPVGTPNSAEYLTIRPLGNAAGEATGPLLYHYFMGEAQRMLGNPAATDPIEKIYPAGNLPFDVEIRHKYFTDPAHPQVNGWGFRVELIGSATTRNPALRAIGVYSDAAATQYLWTTGALSLGTSDWQVDANGTPLQVWYTHSWDGDRPAQKKDWHIAMLKGSAQEGIQTLGAGVDGIRYLFWDRTQGMEPPAGATWVDTGVTITQLVGAGVYRVSGIPSGLTMGQALRLGATATTAFNGFWPTTATPSDYLKITPHVSAANGVKVWKWA
jgi:hypothetical protein